MTDKPFDPDSAGIGGAAIGILLTIATVAVIAIILAAAGQSQDGPPTAKCADGTTSYSSHHSGTCSGHGGVSYWMDGTLAAP